MQSSSIGVMNIWSSIFCLDSISFLGFYTFLYLPLLSVYIEASSMRIHARSYDSGDHIPDGG